MSLIEWVTLGVAAISIAMSGATFWLCHRIAQREKERPGCDQI
jgi:hypothetical protein